jgi:hypothetical protein
MNTKKESKKTNPLLAILIPACIALLALAGFFFMRALERRAEQYYRKQYLSFSLDTEGLDYGESTALLSNPGGYFDLCGYVLSDDVAMDDLQKKLSDDIASSSDIHMVLLEINLCRYRDCDLSDDALRETDAILSAWGDAGFQIILRFLYDWDGKADESEPDRITTVESHMRSLAPTVNSHADNIYCMQGIFVGNFAEMNGGHLMDWDSMCELANCLDEVIDPGIFLSVRTPAQRRLILSSEEIFPAGSTLGTRLGLYNDGMLGSETDYGTYGVTDRSEVSLGSGWLRAQELDYQDSLCRLVPNGGEAVVDNPYNDAPSAIKDLGEMHVSYLSRMHHAEVLEKWKNSTVTTNDVWSGQDAYTYIGAHLGARYRCAGVQLSSYDEETHTTELNVTWCNTGFAPSYAPVTLTLQILDAQGSLVSQTSYDSKELTTICNGETTDISLSLALSAYSEGTYRILLSCEADGESLEQASRLQTVSGAHQVAAFTVDRTPNSIPSSKELLHLYLSSKKAALAAR